MIARAPEAARFAAPFDAICRRKNREPAWLDAVRRAGFAAFAERGFPTLKDEEWKYTDISPLRDGDFRFAAQRGDAADLPSGLPEPAVAPGAAGAELVFVNGIFSPRASRRGRLPDGVIAGSLAELLGAGRSGELARSRLGRIAAPESGTPFAALNAALFEDGAFVFVPAGTSVAEPMHIALVSAGEDGVMCHPRNLIVLEPGASLVVVESFTGPAGSATFTNAVTEIAIGAGARLAFVKVQLEGEDAFHMATVRAAQEEGSRFTFHSVAVGARIGRTDAGAVLQAEGCACTLDGLYAASGRQLIDHHTLIDHAAPRCSSEEMFHGILDGEARGVFNGKILVRQDAQKTDALQTNRALLLSDKAAVDTKPQLEIFADDVRCTHGATIGQLDEEALFYLRTRGVGAERARRILIGAFAGGVLGRIENEQIRAALARIVARKGSLGGEIDLAPAPNEEAGAAPYGSSTIA